MIPPRTPTNGIANGTSNDLPGSNVSIRFSQIPRALDIPVSGGDSEEAVEVDLEDLMDDPTELCTLLENENVSKANWMTIALAYAKQKKMELAINIINRGMGALRSSKSEDRLSMLSCLCWMLLWQCRAAPRLRPASHNDSEIQLKDHFVQSATSALNDASRINPTYPPLFLARGTLYLLKASLLMTKAGLSQRANIERIEMLQQAIKSFDDSLKSSSGRNMMAMIGKARALFSLGRYAESYSAYQMTLEHAPDLHEPDPRIGIGCCLWQLGHKEDARQAWARALEINKESKIANVLLGLYHLDHSSKFPTTDAAFHEEYKKAMTQYNQTAYKLDNAFPLTCATFGNYFLLRKAWPTLEKLAKQAVDFTDVNAIASDGWYLLARKEHYQENFIKAVDFYNRADQARGGDDAGYLPAKFGAAQLKVLTNDLAGAKFKLEKIVQQTKNIEAMTLLGIIHAEESYNLGGMTRSVEEIQTEAKKAIAYLEQVRVAYKDPNKKLTPDANVLLNLARLYEHDYPDRSLQCLQQVEQMELDQISENEQGNSQEGNSRESLPPQLLNNIAAFDFRMERYAAARESFQLALNACVKVGDNEKDEAIDADALVTTISFNLARTYEAEGMMDEAQKVYEGLLDRHPSYVDARLRLTYILLKNDSDNTGAKAIKALAEAYSSNLDVRTLYAWYLTKHKKRTLDINADDEHRYHKVTLQKIDQGKHDKYALTAMGNIHMQSAREMPRNSEQEKDRRSRQYQRAVEFFDKVLQLDPRNVYAAQGLAIALIEEAKDTTTGIQILTKVKETIKDSSVYKNLGHVYCEVKQYGRAIENYEIALSREREHDAQILSCLGRVWYLKGKAESSLHDLKRALDYSRSSLAVTPGNLHMQFNIAFVQSQIATTINSLPENARSVADLEAATTDLEEGIDIYTKISQAPNPPFPRHDIEQRLNMAKNTLRKQLERALQSQKEFENKNAMKFEEARKAREADKQKREAERKLASEQEEERRQKIKEERERMNEQDREISSFREAEEKLRADAEMTTDEETGERKKREKKKAVKRKKKNEDSDVESQASSDEEDRDRKSRDPDANEQDGEEAEENRPSKKKRRRLEQKSKPSTNNNSKFKSAERIVDSDDDVGDDENVHTAVGGVEDDVVGDDVAGASVEDVEMADDTDMQDTTIQASKKRFARVIEDEDD